MDLPSNVLEPGGLDGGDFVLTECFANDIQPGSERCLSEGPVFLPRKWRSDGRFKSLLRIDEFGLSLSQ